MSDFTIIKCPSCDTSHVQMQDANSINCSKCGKSLTPIIEKTKNVAFTIASYVVALSLLLAAFLLWIEIKTPKKIPKPPEFIPPKIKLPVYNPSNYSLPKVDASALTITNDQVKKYQQNMAKPRIDIINQVHGKSQDGGKFWILTIQNNGLIKVARPAVTMNIDDNNGKRLDQITAWSKTTFLHQGQDAYVLLNLPKSPDNETKTTFDASAQIPNKIDAPQISIDVENYQVINNDGSGKNFNITGQIINNNKIQVDFIEIVAIAKDENDKAVGIAFTYASTSNLPPMKKSSFEIYADKFIIKQPKSWEIFAYGRKHK